MKNNQNQTKTIKKLVFILLLIFIIASLTSADPYKSNINKPTSPASLPSSGTLTTSTNTGAAVYSYPFMVPPGTNGLQPGLNLGYSSYNKNSYPELTGSGWSLTQSYVQRDTDNFPSDTSKHKFNLILDGASHELVYDSSDGRYHTTIESYLSIKKLSGGNNDQNEYWEVKSKDGTRYLFGYNLDSELKSNQHNYIWRWYLDQVIDVHGNKIFYTYKENPYSYETGVTYLDKIEYNNDKTRKIKFSYNSLPRSWTIFQDGQKIKRTRRLSEIKTYANDNLIKKYAIGYTNNYVTTRTYISSITEYGKDGGSLPATTFSYKDFEKGWERDEDLEQKLPSSAYFSHNGADGGSRLIDINRDGITDILRNSDYKNVEQTAYINSYKTDFTIDSSYEPPETAAFILKYDDTPIDSGVRIGDYNGDGYPDLIQGLYDEDGDDEYDYIWENTGSGWRKTNDDFVTIFTTAEEHPYKSVDEGVRLVDLNGDGYVDVLKAKDRDSKKAWINNQNGGWSSSSQWKLPSDIYFVESDGDDEGVRLIDINGDGLTDVYRSDDKDNKNLWLNTGNGWEETNDWPINILPDNVDTSNDDEGMRISDINGDGLPDFVLARSSRRDTYLNQGEKFTYDSSWEVPEFAEFVMSNGNNEGTRLADIDGDGSVDIVRIKREGGNFKLAWKNKAQQQFLLDEVNLPSGGQFKIRYYNSAITPDNDMGFNQWIVLAINYLDATEHHSTATSLDCVPSSCPYGYQDTGIDCTSSSSVCQRKCVKMGCSGQWSTIFEQENSWNEYDFERHAYSVPLFNYSNFEEDICYSVATWSDDNIVDDSDIDYEDRYETDSVLALYWEMSDHDQQPWGGNCEPDSTGSVLNRRYYYLIDDSDNGEDYNTADRLGGRWSGNCIPPSKGCSGFTEPCTTECYGNTWSFEIVAVPDMPQDYEPLDPDDNKGACKSRTSSYYADTEYIDFKSNRDVGMIISSAPLTITSTNHQTCQKIKSLQTVYSYEGGLYDYEDKEFRGFNYVKEIKPSDRTIHHWFHQDYAKNGMEYKTEVSYGGISKTTENDFFSIKNNDYYTVKLDSTKEILTEFKDNNPVTTQINFQYDDYNNIVKTSYLGDTSISGDEKYSYNEYTYDTNKWILNRPTKTYVKGSDDSTKVSESYFTYDEYGSLVKSESWLSTGQNPTTTYEYDSYGNQISVTDSNQNTLEYEYDSTHTFPIKSINVKNHETISEYDFGTGNLLSVTDPNNYKTEYKYDQFSRRIKEILPYDTEDKPSKEIIYDFDGSLPERAIVKQKQSEDSTLDSYYYYDGIGNVMQTKTETSDQKFITKDYYYDNLYRLNYETNFYYSDTEDYVGIRSAVAKTRYFYDTLDRIFWVVKPDQGKIVSKHKYYLTELYDENDNRIDYLKDAYGNIIQIKEYDNDEIYTTNYKYDTRGNLIQITDNENNKIKHTYDSLGRKTKLEDPDLGTWIYEYDVSGNLIKQIDNENNQVTLTYDELYRLKTKTSADTLETYTYDLNTLGTLSKIQTNDITKEFDYDQRYRIIKDKRKIDNLNFLTVYEYNTMDQITKEILPNNETIVYTYDSVGRLENVNDIITDIRYNVMNMPVARTFKNNLKNNYYYNQLNYRVSNIITSGVQSLAYTYDNVGNVMLIEDLVHNGKEEFEYDDLDRLIKAQKIRYGNDNLLYDLSYEYDSIGNMLYLYADDGNIEFLYDNLAHTPTQIITNSQGIPCTENWQCTQWSECIGGQQTRSCSDLNQCDTTKHKPQISQECCSEDWTCSDWPECDDSLQSRICTDDNQCGTMEQKPEEEQECIMPNNPPVFEEIDDREIDENQILDIWVRASDEDKDDELTLTNNFSQLQTAENYDYGNEIRRKYRWQPGLDDAGIYNVLFTVTDLRGAKDYEEMKITVNDIAGNTPPYISPDVPNQEVDMNSEPWMIDLTDYENDAQDSGRKLRWKVEFKEIEGLGDYTADIIAELRKIVQFSLNSNTDVLRFYPVEDKHGTVTLTLTLKDSNGLTDSQDIDVVINENSGPDYKLKIGVEDDDTGELINSVVKFGKKQKYANPYALFKIVFDERVPVKIKAKDYDNIEQSYYFDERVLSCGDSCSFRTGDDEYHTQCSKDDSIYECECSFGTGRGFNYDYDPATEEFLVIEDLDKCNIACNTDSDCNDYVSSTKDYCINPGKCNAKCQNKPCNVKCESNSDCDDGKSNTKDICFLAKTCNSYCKNKQSSSCNMECMRNSDCDDNDDNTYDMCRNARTCNAVCEFISVPNLKPDLVVEDFGVKTYFGNIVVVKFKIKNSGDAVAENVGWELDTGGATSDPSSTESLTLRPDQSANVYSTGNYDNPGSYTMVLTVDPDNLVKEKDESNNVGELGVSV